MYSLVHRGAGYTSNQLSGDELTQQAKYGGVTFSPRPSPSAPGQSAVVHLQFSPPADIDIRKGPLFSGFIGVTDSDGEALSVPYHWATIQRV